MPLFLTRFGDDSCAFSYAADLETLTKACDRFEEEFKTLASPFRILRPDPTKPFIIGRSSECSLSFKDRSVSRLHAEITFQITNGI